MLTSGYLNLSETAEKIAFYVGEGHAYHQWFQEAVKYDPVTHTHTHQCTEHKGLRQEDPLQP